MAGIYDEAAAYDDGKILCHYYITSFRANCYHSIGLVHSFDKFDLVIILAFFVRTIVCILAKIWSTLHMIGHENAFTLF